MRLLLMLACVLLATAAFAGEDPFSGKRVKMVDRQIRARGVADSRVLDAMRLVPRHLFVPENVRSLAYEDYPLPIGSDQTISQPYIVALMASLLELKGGEKVLEIGTGSGYQAAVLSHLAREVYTIEILAPLSERARKTIEELRFPNIHFRVGDGWSGWSEEAPFDAILVTAAPAKIPQPLVDQLRIGGRMVIPVGRFFQDLLVLTKTETGYEKKNVIPVRFVPMTGQAEKESAPP